MSVTRQVLVKLTEREYEWLMAYAAANAMTIEGVIRMGIRAHNMLHMTPGALDAVAKLQPRMPLLHPEDAA